MGNTTEDRKAKISEAVGRRFSLEHLDFDWKSRERSEFTIRLQVVDKLAFKIESDRFGEKIDVLDVIYMQPYLQSLPQRLDQAGYDVTQMRYDRDGSVILRGMCSNG